MEQSMRVELTAEEEALELTAEEKLAVWHLKRV